MTPADKLRERAKRLRLNSWVVSGGTDVTVVVGSGQAEAFLLDLIADAYGVLRYVGSADCGHGTERVSTRVVCATCEARALLARIEEIA